MPCTPVGICPGDGVGGGPVRVPAILHVRARVHGRAHEWMPELDARRSHGHEALVLRLAEPCDVQPHGRTGVADDAQVGAAYRDDEEHGTALGIHLREAPAEGIDDRARHTERHAGLEALDDVAIGEAELEERQGVARRRTMQAEQVLVRGDAAVLIGQQFACGVEVDARQPHRGQAVDDRIALGAPSSEQDGDGIRAEAPRGEGQGIRRRCVREMQVIHHHGDGAVLGEAADQAEHRGADREPVASVAPRPDRGQRERRRERIRLRARDARQRVQRGTQQLQEHRERDLALRLESRWRAARACR